MKTGPSSPAAAKRIGDAIVRELARAGYGVAIHCNASRAEADALAAELAAGGARQRWWREISPIPAICSALVGRRGGATGSADASRQQRLAFRERHLAGFRIPALEPAFLGQPRAPALLAQAFAAQVGEATIPRSSTSSTSACSALTPQNFSYTLSKAALHAATTTMAQALAPRIRVNAVGPGPTAPSVQDGERGSPGSAGVPLQHGVKPSEIAEAVLYLACARASPAR